MLRLLFNENRRLYSDKRSPYAVSNRDQPKINYIFGVDTNLGSSIFFNDVWSCSSKVVVLSKFKKDKKVVDE